MGDVFSNLSNFSQALDYYQNAKKLSREIKEISLEFEVEMGLGILEFNLGRYNNSLEIFNNAVKLINTDADRFAYADILHKIAITEYALFDYENAEKHFLKSAQISQELGDIYTEILFLMVNQ